MQEALTFPSKHPNFPSLSRPRNLHFPPPQSARSPAISLPPKPTKSPQNRSVSITAPQEHLEISNGAVCPRPSLEFQEKLLYLDSIGIDLFAFITTHPPIVSASLDDIKSIVDFFHNSVSLTTPDIRRVLAMCPELLTTPLSALVPVITFLLREAGVEGRNLRHVIHRRPRLLTCSVQGRLRPTLYFLQGTIGIENVSRHTSLLSCSVEQKFMPRIDYFQKLGFSYDDTIYMFRRFPSLFCYSVKENFRPKFDYFVVEMGRDSKELKQFPQYFSFSLENRIKLRHRRCVEKGVFLSLPLMLKSSEERFQKRLEVFCSSSIPVRTSPLWYTNSKSNSNSNSEPRL